jgi:hypothetical protein
MKINTAMPAGLKPFYRSELAQSAIAFSKGELQRSWNHLERAHIIAQPYPVQHTAVHWKMLKFGVRIKSFREVIGQVPRLLVGGVKSFVGKVPVGNTGGANVPPLMPMEIPEDLARIIGSVTA